MDFVSCIGVHFGGQGVIGPINFIGLNAPDIVRAYTLSGRFGFFEMRQNGEKILSLSLLTPFPD